MTLPAPLRLMCVLAHPDDESLGVGGTLLKYASEGVETSLVCATLGERGRFGDVAERPPADVVARVREQELRAAATHLGVRDVSVLGYPDGGLDRANAAEIAERIAVHIRRLKPHVVVTFGPEGLYGHPDHIAISQFATAAVVRAAGVHQVSKLYYLEWNPRKSEALHRVMQRTGGLPVDGVQRVAAPWPDWEITAVIDTRATWPAVWHAVRCHETQINTYRSLEHLSPEDHDAIWGSQEFYRAYSLVNSGRALETDLFDGLR